MSDVSSVDAPASRRSPTWVRLLRTPISDLLRGRLLECTPAQNVTADTVLANADLPESLAMLARQVSAGTRLWKSERLDVLRELLAHFSDGLERGFSADELAKDFGDPYNAARLIRRAKKRQRPLWWRTLRLALFALLALIGVYLLLALRFFMGRPNIAHNYVADIQAMVNANPQLDRAWPVYRQALIAMGQLPALKDDPSAWDFRAARPGEPNWQLAEEFITMNAASIAMVREAADRKVLGFMVGTTISPEDLALWPESSTQPASNEPLMDNCVMGVLLPYLAEMRRLAFVLVVDARRAAAEGDGETVVANLTAIINMTKQLRDLPILIQDLVGNAILALAAESAGDLVARSPEAFNDSQLQKLAHRLAAVRDSDITARLHGERMFFNDILQRLYTDDGNGDGRMTAGGMRVMAMITNWADNGKPFDLHDVTRVAAAPAMSVVALGRADIHREYNALMDQFEAEAARPLWEQDSSVGDQQVAQWMSSPFERYRRLPLVLLAPAIGKASQTAELTKMSRDVAITAIALEMYRRRHDRWPTTLDELVPAILPAIPPDRFDGKPLKYALTPNGPILYCVGSDGDDDGGTLPVDSQGNVTPDAARFYKVPSMRASAVNGDWILWPAPVAKSPG